MALEVHVNDFIHSIEFLLVEVVRRCWSHSSFYRPSSAAHANDYLQRGTAESAAI